MFLRSIFSKCEIIENYHKLLELKLFIFWSDSTSRIIAQETALLITSRIEWAVWGEGSCMFNVRFQVRMTWQGVGSNPHQPNTKSSPLGIYHTEISTNRENSNERKLLKIIEVNMYVYHMLALTRTQQSWNHLKLVV